MAFDILNATKCWQGRVSARLGDLKASQEHFENRIIACRGANHRVALAHCAASFSEMLLDRDASGDREKALEFLEEGIGITVKLGMTPLEKRLLDLREKAESIPARVPAFPDGLTSREVEVLCS